jgi:hypothetical protein
VTCWESLAASLRRVLGCSWLGHVWHYYAEAGERDLVNDWRVCEISGCGRREIWLGAWVERKGWPPRGVVSEP